MESNGKKSWTESFRIVTPLLLLCINLLAGMIISNQNTIISKVDTIDSKMFTHLTNAGIHIPRETVVSKDEFLIYQTMRDKQNGDIKDAIVQLRTGQDDIKKLLVSHMTNDKSNVH